MFLQMMPYNSAPSTFLLTPHKQQSQLKKEGEKKKQKKKTEGELHVMENITQNDISYRVSHVTGVERGLETSPGCDHLFSKNLLNSFQQPVTCIQR